MSWTSLLWRNLSRNKLRSLLTGGAIALAVALLCFLATMPDGLERMLDSAAGATRIVVHHEAGLAYDIPHAYLAKIRALPGVLGATSWIWFGGEYREEAVTFPSFAIEPDDVGSRGWRLALTFTIVGEIPHERVPQLWLHREYLANAVARGW